MRCWRGRGTGGASDSAHRAGTVVHPLIETHPDPESLSEAVADRIAELACDAVEARGVFAIALAGGGTPRRAYELLATRHRHDVPWERVEAFFGDERCVPPDDRDSNFAMAWSTLLSHVPIVSERVHPVYLGGETPEVAAARCDALLRRRFPEAAEGAADARTFDLVLLGAGADGHTASLFPGSRALLERARWALAVEAPPESAVRHRVTLTPPPIELARTVLVVAAGASKHGAIAAALAEARAGGPPTLPLARVRGADSTHWMLDRAAADE